MRAAVSAIEHKAVLAAAHAVCHLGGRGSHPPGRRRRASSISDALDAALAQHPAVVSVMWVNNEIGVIQPIAEIAARCCAAGVLLHTDAVQAFGKVAVSFRQRTLHDAHASPATRSAPPRASGALVVRDRKAVEAIIHGGGQQYGIRPGTENVAGAVGLGRAAELARRNRGRRAAASRTAGSSGRAPQASVPDLVVAGEASNCAPHVLNVAIAGTDSEALLMHLDLAGIAASGGSACSTGAVEPSHVLLAIGMPRELALGAVRFSLGHESTEADVDRAAEVMPGVVAKVRKLAGILGRA